MAKHYKIKTVFMFGVFLSYVSLAVEIDEKVIDEFNFTLTDENSFADFLNDFNESYHIHKCTLGDPESCSSVSAYYYLIGMEKDATEYLSKACLIQESGEVCYVAGSLNLELNNTKNAILMLQKACQSNHKSSCNLLKKLE